MDWFKGFFDWLWCLLKGFFYWLLDTLADIYNWTIGLLIMLLPESPFQFEQIDWGPLGNSIGYFIPIATIIQHFVVILAAIGTYVVIRHVLRLIRMVK